jgi:mono/diheme cytochrome c family protein
MTHKKNQSFTIAYLLAAASVWFLPTILLADVDKEPDYTSQQTWQGGMQSGSGNFMANCVACHGPEGKGDGVLADSLDVKPRDLANKQLISALTDEYLFKVIKNGGASVGLSESMTPWGTTFSDKEIRNIVQHIRTNICKCKYIGGK